MRGKALLRAVADTVRSRRRHTVADPFAGAALPPPGDAASLRIDTALWERVRAHIDDPNDEQAGVLLVRLAGPDTVVAVGWLPVPEEHVTSREHGLDYDGRFHLDAARAAATAGAGMILVHAHGGDHPEPSRTDRERGAAFVGFAERRLPDAPHGLMVVGARTATVRLAAAGRDRTVRTVRVVGARRAALQAGPWDGPRQAAAPPGPARTAAPDEPDRQELVFGAAGTDALGRATVAVVGLSGGGSHVYQQLIHAGVGTLIAVDDDRVERSNLRRLVTAVDSDAGAARKTALPVRLAASLHAGRTRVVAVPERFPAPAAVGALRRADVIVGCVDGWDARDDLNTFALEHRIPYVDIGAAVKGGPDGPRVSGQVAVVLPDGPCLRCVGLVDDARADASRRRRQGYVDGEPEPQVVSVNGVLASEAVTAVLLLLATGAAPVEPLRSYRYPPGKLSVVQAARRADCPACARAGLG